jgi:rod shape-determining protein MreC
MQNNMPKVYLIIVAIIIVLSFASMFVWTFEGESGFLHNLQAKCSSAISLNSGLGTNVQVNSNSSDDNASQETLSALKEQNESLTAQVAKGEEYRQEAQRLQELLNLKDKYNITGISAHVIGKSSESWDQSFTVDIGSNGGSFVGATVCASYGVVGQVTSVTETTSKVRLLTDSQSGVSAMVQSSRATCIVKGSLDGLITAENISQNVEVKEGDIIITSGLGGSFVKGIIIGTVTRVSGNASDGTLKAVLKQSDTTSFEEVIIVSDAAGETEQSE